MKIAGLQKQSFIEYPGKIAAVLFIAGCNFRCPWCYVPDLVLPERIKKIKKISENEIFSFLKKRKKFLEAVVITGGEPTINKDLPDFIKKIKNLNYLVGLETNGSNFRMLKSLISKKLIDYVAMDIKQDLVFEKYNRVVGGILRPKIFESIKKSINLSLNSKIDYEFRTTLVKEFHKKEDVIEICKKIKGAKIYYLQTFEKKGETVSGKKFTPFSEKEILEILKEGKRYLNVKARPWLI
jgi:pyruvate formate lyase activating enzyme